MDNPNKLWSDIDASLPKEKIEVLGPPPTSGTRDSFMELAMEPGAAKFKSLADLKKSDVKAYDAVWKSMREDGAFVEAGENDNLIVQKLQANRQLSASLVSRSSRKTPAPSRMLKLTASTATYETIASGDYKMSRPLYIYVKKQHVGVVPGIAEFVAEYVSEKALGEDGYLGAKGLITLPGADAEKIARRCNGDECSHD